MNPAPKIEADTGDYEADRKSAGATAHKHESRPKKGAASTSSIPKPDIDDRECGKCKKLLPLTEFAPLARGGLLSQCRECTRVYARDWYEQNKERKLTIANKYYKANYEKIKQMAYKRRDPFKAKANAAISNAVAAGKLIKQPCIECGEPKADFHHNNGYDKENWFTGVWLCRKHHAQTHKELRWQNQ